MDSKSGTQAKSIKRRKSGKGRKDMEGYNVPNKTKNLKEKDCENQLSAQSSQKVANTLVKKVDVVEPSKINKDGKIPVVSIKNKLEDKTTVKVKKCGDTIETRVDAKCKKTFNLGDDFKDAIEKRNDEAEAGIHSLSKNIKYARMKKKTNEKIQDSWNRSFMKNTASFMSKEDMKQDKTMAENKNNKEDSNESLCKANINCKQIEKIIIDEIGNVHESTEAYDEHYSENIISESVDTADDNAQVSKSIETLKKIVDKVIDENKEMKYQKASSTERSIDSKDHTTQTKFPPYRSRFVSDSEGIKKFIKDHSKSNNSTRLSSEDSHQKQESSVSSNETSKESSEPSVVDSGEAIDEEDKPVKFFISDDESDSDTAIFVDAAPSEPQDQDISDSDMNALGSDNIDSERELSSEQIIENNENTDTATPNILENDDVLNNDSCLPINMKNDKTDSSVYIDMIEDNSEKNSDKDTMDHTAKDKNNISNFDYGASAIDKIFHDLTFDHKEKGDNISEPHIRKEKEDNLICFPWAGEETQEYRLGQILKSTSDENKSKTCENESDPKGVDFAEPKSSEEKEKPSKTDQSSRTISGFGRSYRNFQRYEGITNSIAQEKFVQAEITGNETVPSMGKNQDISGQDNVVCGTVNNDTKKMKKSTEVVDTMSFLGITDKVEVPNISTPLEKMEKMEGELEMKTEQYIKQKSSEIYADAQAKAISKTSLNLESPNNKNINEPLPFATAFETLASIKKSLLEAQEYPFQNKLNELSGYTKMKSEEDMNISRDCTSETNQKTAVNNSIKPGAGIGDKIKEMLGLCNISEEMNTSNSKTLISNSVHSTHIDMSNTINLGEKNQNNFSQMTPKNTPNVDGNSEINSKVETLENVSLAANSSLKEADGAISKAETLLKSGKNVFNICDPRKISFSGINRKCKLDINPPENQSNRLVNQKDGKGIKQLKKYSTRSLSQPVPVKTDNYEILSESDLLPHTKFTNEGRKNRLKAEKPSLRRTMSQDESEETSIQTIHPSKYQSKKVSEKILKNIEDNNELIRDSMPGSLDKDMNVTDGQSKLVDVESSEDTSLITWSTDSPIIDHCKSSEFDSYTKYFKKFTHTKSEKFVHTLTDTAYEPLEDEKIKIPEPGAINSGLWDQKKFDELNIKNNTSDNQDRTNEEYSSILIFDDLCPDKWKEQCKVDVNVDKQNESSFKLGNISGIKKEPLQKSIPSENVDVKVHHFNIEKQSQSSIKKHKVSWLLNNDSDIEYSQSTSLAKQSVTEGAHSKPKRLQSPPPKLPSAIEISDADFDAAIMSPTSPDFNASGSLNTLLSKLSNADICMDKKYIPLTKFSDQFQSGQPSKPHLFTSTLKVSECNQSSKNTEQETSTKRPELVSTTIADWKVSSPVFEAELTLSPTLSKNQSTTTGLKEPTYFFSTGNKVSLDESHTKTNENVIKSKHTFPEKIKAATESSIPPPKTFAEKKSAPSLENQLSSLFSVREKRTPVTPIQSPTGFKGNLGIPTLPTEDLIFSDIVEDSKFKLEGVKSTKI
ncbi:unnamed protein product [Meganyctiphanes norvegica]|uniref:Uncharacterized protein n=1 Tax=Meganyctiphanes norvegica TaxID=48144 RepID=A0AAV2QKS1_MEGNR